uniref:Vomeronasal type-1 receptor n=1 Tax=Macaca nemestrina TaxID=9545 RepID=A0A2K6D335_MACNE
MWNIFMLLFRLSKKIVNILYSSDTTLGILPVFQTGIGLMGNSLLFIICMYIILFRPHQKNPLDVILISTFVDTCCKTGLYIYKMTRDICVCTSSLLSIFQAVIISPCHSKWACKSTNVGLGYSLIYCKTNILYTTMQRYFKVPCLLKSSFYMVTIFLRHQKMVFHIHSISLSPQSFPETEATRVVFLLVSCFVFFYGTNMCLSTYISSTYENSLILENSTSFVSSSYPIICTLMLINYDNRVSRLTCAILNMITSPCLPHSFLLHQRNPDKNYFNYKRMHF